MIGTGNKGFKCSLRNDRVDPQEKAPKPIRTTIRNIIKKEKKNNFNNYLNKYKYLLLYTGVEPIYAPLY